MPNPRVLWSPTLHRGRTNIVNTGCTAYAAAQLVRIAVFRASVLAGAKKKSGVIKADCYWQSGREVKNAATVVLLCFGR